MQNAGYNVKRGTRFLTASDHYLTAVYDDDNDNVIQNDEIITYSIANIWDGSANDNFSFVARFDVDGDGSIQAEWNVLVTEWRTAREARMKANTAFEVLADFSESGFPGGWSVEGDGRKTIVALTRNASISYVQRRLKIGYNRAARIIEQMEVDGMIGPQVGTRSREVFLRNPDEDEE